MSHRAGRDASVIETVYRDSAEARPVPARETTNPDGVDYGWVMQVTFVATIVVGAPVVAVLSTTTELASWTERALFAVRVGAPIWFCTSIAAYLYARREA